MAIARRVLRCLPGLSTILLVLVLCSAFLDLNYIHAYVTYWILKYAGIDSKLPTPTEPSAHLSLSQRFFIFYCIFAHLDALLFPIRLCIALVVVTRKTRQTLWRRPAPAWKTYVERGQESEARRDSVTEDRVAGDSHASELLDVSDRHAAGMTKEVVHAIIVPNYAEELDTLRQTLNVLASHPRAQKQYEIHLAMEEKEVGSKVKAEALFTEFDGKFAGICRTFHPAGLPGELAGKGSNVAFAARNVFSIYRQDPQRSDVIITIIDSDTHLLQDYFTEIRRYHHTHPESAYALYVCPIIFDRNAHTTNVIARVADIMWGCAGLSAFLPWSPLHIPTSVYSLPLSLAEDVGGWDADPTAIGEDMHMCLKTYFSTNGRLATLPIYSAASQCNVSAPGRELSWRRSILTFQARYKQAERHMWGCLDSGYAAHQFLLKRFLQWRNLALFHLLWEAHFFPVHFVLMLVAYTLYGASHPPWKIHPALTRTFRVCDLLRSSSFVAMQAVLTLYNFYHALCLKARARDMQAAAIAEEYAIRRSWRPMYLAERFVFPVSGIVYGAVPTLYAQICHLWTDRLVYTVSLKPTRAVREWEAGVVV